MQQVEDLRPVELLTAGTLAGATLILGFMPGPVLDLVNASALQLSNLFVYQG
jgi:NADH-quinone oxidoreductase subunit M